MSGIYIPGMEMPTCCCACPCSYDNYCAITNEHTTFDEWAVSRRENCPLIPVPEHGDLIDTRPFDVLSFHNPEPGYENTFMDGVLWMEDKIDNAPVVIPADPEEEEDG